MFQRIKEFFSRETVEEQIKTEERQNIPQEVQEKVQEEIEEKQDIFQEQVQEKALKEKSKIPQTEPQFIFEESLKRVTGNGSDDFRKNIIKKITQHDALRPYWREKEINNLFILWATSNDINCQWEIVKPEFANELQLELQNVELTAVSYANWSFKIEELPENNNFYPIAKGLYLEIQHYVAPPPSEKEKISYSKARINIFAKKGSLSDGAYLLDANKQSKYNIGRGALNGFRENHIVIEEAEQSPFFELNQYVSRSHACIIFSNKYGFCLQVNEGGCRPDNRTRIIRDEKPIEIENLAPMPPEPLLNGDIIELGKSVLLKFEIITDEEPTANRSYNHAHALEENDLGL